MKTDVQDTSETRKTVTVRLTGDEVTELESKLVRDFMKQVKVPGFRPGKVPESMVRSRFGKDIKEELRSRVITQAYQEGVAKQEMQIFQTVDVEAKDPSKDEESVIVFTVDILPEFELPDYEGLKVTTPSSEASEEEIERLQNQVLSQRAEFNVVEKAAEEGDYVQCSYEGKIGDELVSSLVPEAPMYGSQKSTWEEAGAEHAPGVRAVVDGVVGMKAGDSKEVTMDFPEDFKPEQLAGKTATYTIEVTEVREKVLPELDEELLKALGVESEEELKKSLKENIENQKKQQNANSERQQISEILIGKVDFPVPESAIEGETDGILRDFMQRNLQQGVTAEELEKNKESLHAGASNAAIGRIKSRMILLKIAEKENVKVEQDDFGRMIMSEAQQTNQKPEKIVKDLQKDQARIDNMRREILLGKTMDLIVEKAERVTEEPKAEAKA